MQTPPCSIADHERNPKAQQIFASSAVQLSGLTADQLSSNGLRVCNPAAALHELGYDDVTLATCMPTLENRGVQQAPAGIVQDPAGNAVAASMAPKDAHSGGASGAIYRKFPDLDPIPKIPEGSSVFNSSTGPGHRVLHTYSPTLHGNPSQVSDCQTALQELANAYANALLASTSAAGFSLLNLVPVSGRIFAGNFRDLALNHLHPSYTITSVWVAQAELLRNGDTVLPTTLNYYDAPVFNAAKAVLALGPTTS